MSGATPAGTAGPETLGIEPWVLELLACPDTHHTRLRVDVEAGELVCPTCDRGFRVVDGIPDLLLDEARQRGGTPGGAGGGGGSGGTE